MSIVIFHLDVDLTLNKRVSLRLGFV